MSGLCEEISRESRDDSYSFPVIINSLWRYPASPGASTCVSSMA